MAITADLIKQQDSLKDLTDDQIKAVETLSKNDEEAVIHSKRGEFYNQFDKEILEYSGYPKEGHERASDYAKRVLAAQKAQIEELSTYKTKVGELQTQITSLKDGKVDAATTQKIKDLESELATVKDTHQKEIQAKEALLTEKEKALISEKEETEFAKAISGMNFKKDDQSAALKAIALKQAKADLKSEATMEVADGKVIWRDAKGEIIRNAKNGNEPATTADLLMPKLAPVIDQGRKVTGTGGKTAEGSTFSATGFNPTAKTKTEFYSQASDYLIAQGQERTDPKFAAKLSELSKEFNAQDLPVS